MYNFDAVDNSMYGLITHTIRTEAIAVVVEQAGGVRPNAIADRSRKLNVCKNVREASSFTLKTQLTEIILSKVWIQGFTFTLLFSKSL